MFLRNAMMTLLCSATLFSTACQEDLASPDGEAIEADVEAEAATEAEEEAAGTPSLFAVLSFTLAAGDSTEFNGSGLGGTRIKAKNTSNQTGEFCVQAGLGGEDCTEVPPHSSRTITPWFWGLEVHLTNVGDVPLKFTITN